MKRALTQVIAVLLLVGGIVAGSAALTGSEQTTAWSAISCTEPTAPDRDATEQYAACRASELAGVLSSLPPVPTVTATATETATATVTVTATATTTVTATPAPEPAKKVIGMSAPASLWGQRLTEVGPCGVEARRIFADLTSTGRDQATLIEQAVAAGMLPVISYKVPSVATLNSGGYDTWLDALHTYLTSLGAQVTVTFWHEPYPDLTAAQFLAGSQRFLDHIQDTSIKVGPILNGWLLDRRVPDFAAYTSPGLLDQWDFVGVDSYQTGDATNPGTDPPNRAVPLLVDWLAAQGHGDMPIGVGEYNGYSADMLATAGETLLSTPQVWFGLVWNSTGGKGVPLSGDRLVAYQNTKADTRALHDPPC